MDWEAFYSQFREPDFIPGYEIQNRLGGGAFGEVYKARKASIGKAYAIKFLKIDDDTQREAVERELEQVRHFAAIDHPNLVTIEDMGTVADVPFLIMGYAGEDTLARRLREGKLDSQDALLFFVQTCRGVLALHDRRLVHFDLKPGNVFIKGDIARVGDYGLSKLMVEGRMTLSFGRGTPHYMAPEMIRSRADHRADIYSLGVILFESVSGAVPFEGDTPGALVLRDEDSPPEFPDDFPARLRPVVERCLHLDPNDRYESVAELLEDLGQTARPGDSIRLEPAPDVQRSNGRQSPRQDRPLQPEATTPTSREEIKQTAAVLARGAVEVARSVWDGIRSAGSGTGDKTAGAGGDGKASGAGASEARAATAQLEQVLDEATAAADEASSAAREAQVAAERVIEGAAPATAASTAGRLTQNRATQGRTSRTADEPEPAFAAAAAGTIPVPPRTSGGVVGSVVSTGVLALEVLVTLVTGTVRFLFLGFGRAGDSILRTTGTAAGRLFRLGLFLFVLAFLGAGATLLILVLLSA